MSHSQLLGTPFDALIHSPLARAAETAAIIWGGLKGAHPRCGAAAVASSPSLREIDLHSFQGLAKAAALAAPASSPHAAAYAVWQADPAAFAIDGHFPVRDLWARAEAAWGEVLLGGGGGGGGGGRPRSAAAAPPPPPPPPPASTLVVAHNAVNQALLGVALGLPPSAFRRLAQANGGASEVRLEPRGGGGGATRPLASPPLSPAACVVRLNDRGAAAGPDVRPAKGGRALVVLVAVGEEEKEGGGGGSRAAAVGRALRGGGGAGGPPPARGWATLRSPTVPAGAASALTAAGGLAVGEVAEAPDTSWGALAGRAVGGAAAASPALLLVLARPAEVEVALAAAAGLPPPPPGGGGLPPFAAPAWSVSCVEVDAGWEGGAAAVIRGTGWTLRGRE